MALPRSGSTMLIKTLGQSSQVISFGEILDRKEILGFGNVHRFHKKALYYFRGSHPIEFLERMIFRPYEDLIKAVGFKVFPGHLARDEFVPVWDWLDRNRDIKIVKLTRENYLEAYVSLLIAEKTGKWSTKNPAERTSTQIEVDCDACMDFFCGRFLIDLQMSRQFEHHETLAITYEQLICDFPGHMKRIQQFLAPRPEPLKPRSVKQEMRPLSEVILNYQELHDRLAGTKWASFLYRDLEDREI